MSPYSVDSFDVPSLWAPLSRHGWTVGTCAPEVPAGSASQATSPTGPSPDGPASCWDHLHKPFLVCMVWGPRAFFPCCHHTGFSVIHCPLLYIPLPCLPRLVCTHVCSHMPPLRPAADTVPYLHPCPVRPSFLLLPSLC